MVEQLSHPTSLRLWRGLCGFMVGFLGGPLAAVAVALGFTFCSWLANGTSEIDRAHDITDLRKGMVWPLVGCAAVCACAGWATWAPVGKWRFARSLGFVFLFSLRFWYALELEEWTPRRYKYADHPVFYPSELMLLIGPSAVAAALLTVRRIQLASTGNLVGRTMGDKHADADSSRGSEDLYDLGRFLRAQENDYEQALAEIRGGQKRSHWMWYIFPQIDGLGSSPTAKHFAIKSIEEARAYLAHPVLGPRLRECARAAVGVEGKSAREIFGSPDDLKLRSCATLFACVSPSDTVFDQLLAKYYAGDRDSRTLQLLGLDDGSPPDEKWKDMLEEIVPRQGEWSEDEYLALTDHGSRFVEYTDGCLEVLPWPTDQHQVLLAFLFIAFYRSFETKGGAVRFGPLRVRLRPGKFREPDLVLLLSASDPRRHNRYWDGADLALEVVGADKPERDLVDKRGDYAEAGVPEYWIVNPQTESITVLRLENVAYKEDGVYRRGEFATSVIVPHFSVAVAEVFDSARLP